MTDKSPAHGIEPPLTQALVPVVLLIAMLGAAVYLFGDESSFGPNQIALVLGTAVAGLVGLANGRSWAEIEGAIRRGIATSMGAVLILLVVGSVIGTWILAGIVPTMIYYGLSLLAPSIFYAAACVICAVVALATGSSWTTAGTVGLALIGTAAAYDLHLGIAGRRHHLGRLLRRQDVAAVGYHQPRPGGGRLGALHPHPPHGPDHGAQLRLRADPVHRHRPSPRRRRRGQATSTRCWPRSTAASPSACTCCCRWCWC